MVCWKYLIKNFFFFFFQAEDGIRDLVRSRGLGEGYKRRARGGVAGPATVVGFARGGVARVLSWAPPPRSEVPSPQRGGDGAAAAGGLWFVVELFCLKKKRHATAGTWGARRTLAGNERVAARSPDEWRRSSSTAAGRVADE